MAGAAASLVAEAERLEQLAAATGERRFLAAARALLRPSPPGKPPLDDADALREAEELLRSGVAKKLNAAFRIVARRLGVPPEARKAACERWRRKFDRCAKKSST